MKHFVTLFPNAENVHLVKGVGQIPYHMQRSFGYQSSLVCYRNEEDYLYLKNEVPGLTIHFLRDTGKLFFWEKAAAKYLIKHSKKIDVLNLYHLSQSSMLYGLIYKHLNPRGILYLKLDLDISTFQHKVKFSETAWKENIHQMIYPHFLKKADIISVESKTVREHLENVDKALQKKSFILPVGIDVDNITKKTGRIDFADKENLILTVSRIGTEQKNSEMLLEALKGMDMRNWKMRFIGPVENDFKPAIEQFFKNHPEKREQITFTGEITDRAELMNYYKKAKIFCLPSRWESFGTVLAEAQCMGNYLIGTNKVASIYELTEQGKYGKIVESENAAQLRNALKEAMKNGFYTKNMMHNILNHAQHYNWPVLLKKLNRELTKKLLTAK